MKKITVWAFGLIASIALVCSVGCASIGAAPAMSFDQKLGVAEVTVGSLERAAAQSLDAGVITVAEAQRVLASAQSARAAIVISRGLEKGGNMASLPASLDTINAILAGATKLLSTKGIAP